jgi:hypothetical protein
LKASPQLKRWRPKVGIVPKITDAELITVSVMQVLLGFHDESRWILLFPPEQQGWWYCDLVRIVDHGNVVIVDDLWIDVIIGPGDHPYRVLDLDEYATAMQGGALSVSEAAEGLMRIQRFLDRRLNRRHDTQRSWPDFPPSSIAGLLHAVFPRDWSFTSDGEMPVPLS